LPNYNSKAIVILVVNEGEANIEVVGQREQQQKQREEQREEQEGSWELERYRAELSEDDVFVIPAVYPVAINATSNLNFIAFGINAENNQRNFLAGIYIIYHHQFEYIALVYLELLMRDCDCD